MAVAVVMPVFPAVQVAAQCHNNCIWHASLRQHYLVQVQRIRLSLAALLDKLVYFQMSQNTRFQWPGTRNLLHAVKTQQPPDTTHPV